MDERTTQKHNSSSIVLTQHYIHQKHKRETEKTALANKTIYTLIWYGFYYFWSGNGVGPILTAPEPTRKNNEKQRMTWQLASLQSKQNRETLREACNVRVYI